MNCVDFLFAENVSIVVLTFGGSILTTKEDQILINVTHCKETHT
jgi:hypothetical protein